MGMNSKYSATMQAIPAYVKVKDAIIETYFEVITAQRNYRVSHNPLDLYDFANNVVTLYGQVETDLLADDKLGKNYLKLASGVNKYAMGLPHPSKLKKEEWVGYFNDLKGVIYALNIARLTRNNDDDDDFAGVPGFAGL